MTMEEKWWERLTETRLREEMGDEAYEDLMLAVAEGARKLAAKIDEDILALFKKVQP